MTDAQFFLLIAHVYLAKWFTRTNSLILAGIYMLTAVGFVVWKGLSK